MPKDNVTKLFRPGSFDDRLSEVIRDGARTVLAQAVEVEVCEFVAKHAGLQTIDGLQRVVRHGHLPEREVMTGSEPVSVRRPRVRDRSAEEQSPARIDDLRAFVAVAKQESFVSAADELLIIPPALSRRITKLEEFVGDLLFERTTQMVDRTPSGRALLERAATTTA